MIEIIQETKKTEDTMEGKLPKNIRQIGNPEKDFRIYMEDYVYTYLHPAQVQATEAGILPRLLILLGEIDHFSNRSCAFISGAIQVHNAAYPEELPELNDDTWREIHLQIREYFDKCEIVGWVLDIPGNTLQITEEIEQMHRRNFIGTYQFFFLMDSREREEAFYTWKQGKLTRKEGYFIYYEKNPQMQEYMIRQREARLGRSVPPEMVQDQAAKHYRALMLEKREQPKQRGSGMLSYLTSLLMVVTLCAVSVLLIGNIDRMNKMEETISVMSVEDNIKEQRTAEVSVEAVQGNVYPEEKTVATEAFKNQSNQSITDSRTSQVMAPAAEQTLASTTEVETAPTTVPIPEAIVESVDKAADAVAASDNTKNQNIYIVQKGDNLQQICYKLYQTDAVLDKLCELNAIDNKDAIYEGQKLTLP